MKKSVMVVSLVGLLAGCATQMTPQQERMVARLHAYADQTPECKSDKECETMWARAVSFVAQHSKWKLQIQSEQLIQTFGPGKTMNNAYLVTKVPTSEGNLISAQIGCGNPFGCMNNPVLVLGSFNHFVKTGELEKGM